MMPMRAPLPLHDVSRARSAPLPCASQQAVHHFLIFVRNFGIAAEFVVAGAAREERAFAMDAGQRAGRDRAAVLRQIAEELRHRFELFGGEDRPRFGTIGIVPV